MKILRALAVSGLFAAGTTTAGWFHDADPHTAIVGLPDEQAWPAAVAAVAPGVPAPDLQTATPDQVRRFFARLTSAQQRDLVRRVPAVVGNLDGVPYRLRYAANARAGDQVLGYDPRGDGRLIQVFGDLGTARHIAVLVPGSGWRLANLAGDVPPPGVPPTVSARGLLAETRRLDPAARVAVVVWLGYDAPEAIDKQSVRSERAIAGAPALGRFVAGLPEKAQVTLLCHSYGAVVCGRAAPTVAADDIVALAAPGMDVDTAADLRTAARVWAARTADDPIRFVPNLRFAGFGHGTDPTAPDFGARRVATGTAHGHDGYYTPGTQSLTNLARVVLGRTTEVNDDARV